MEKRKLESLCGTDEFLGIHVVAAEQVGRQNAVTEGGINLGEEAEVDGEARAFDDRSCRGDQLITVFLQVTGEKQLTSAEFLR